MFILFQATDDKNAAPKAVLAIEYKKTTEEQEAAPPPPPPPPPPAPEPVIEEAPVAKEADLLVT